MSQSYVPAQLRQKVTERAQGICEYCQTQALVLGMPLEVDHIISRKQEGETHEANLCLACPRCNRFKGLEIEATDPQAGALVPLFHPRIQTWNDHFVWQNEGLYLQAKTATGRATVQALQMNNDFVVRARRIWILAGWHPPKPK